MADTIERTIYKLELDDSGYIRGVESLSASTKKFTDQQEAANKVLQVNEAALKQGSASLASRKKDLDSFNALMDKSSATVKAANEKYGQQLQKSLQLAQAEEQKLTDKVLQSRKAYQDATKAAQDFANTSVRASNLQAQTTGGKIPTGPPPGITSGITSQIAGVLNVAEFTQQAQIIEQTKNEFDDLAVSIGLAEARMQQLNATDLEFQQLEPIVKKGKEALQQYGNATKVVEQSSGSLRTRLREGREELVKLEQAGKGATKQYFELEKSVAKLTDEFGDQQARIKILASDTKLLDFGKGAITAATSAFQVYTAVSILAGDESEELQKKTMQLFAAMQLLQSLEQLSNLTRREGVLSTLAASGAQAAYTAVVGTSTGALKAFRLALVATGIGAAIVAIGLLIANYAKIKEALTGVTREQNLFRKLNEEVIESVGKESAQLEILRASIESTAVPMATRLQGIKNLKEQFPGLFDGLTKEQLLTGNVADAYDKAAAAILSKARASAAAAGIEKNAAKELSILQKQEIDDQEVAAKLKKAERSEEEADIILGGDDIKVFKALAAERKKGRQEEIADIKKDNDFLLKIAVEGAKETIKVDEPDKPTKAKPGEAKADLQSDFEKRKADLLEQIAKLAEAEFQSEVSIRQVYKVKLDKAILDINKDKSLKPSERKELITLTTTLNTDELTKALDDFKEKQKDIRQKLNDELNNLQDKNTTDSLNLLQDEFDRRAKLIQFNQEKEIVDTITANKDRLIAFEESSKLIYGADFENNKNFLDRKAILVAEGEQVITNIVLKFTEQRKDLAADEFQKVLTAYDEAISNADLIRNETLAKDLTGAKDKFLSEKITYEQFLDEIKRLKDTHDIEMTTANLVTLKNKLAALDREIAETKDKKTKEYAALLEQQKEFRDEISKKEQEAAIKVPPPKDGTTGVERFAKYAENIGALANSIVGFWQAANQAEAAALDRSISLQEKRVDAAQRIAERGNAQYLKAEEDRLTELNIKRENAARKQLGIDAALQASQILVGITGAIAKIANPVTGIAETIGAIAIIVGALATGYGLVKSLQGNQPRLYEGTTELKRHGHPAGRDTIPAWLDEGEAVIPTEKNKKYKKTIEAVYHGKVPADVLNEFVENYVKNNKSIRNYKTDSTENINTSTYNKFVHNISRIPTKVLNQFISNYEKKEEKKYFKGTTQVKPGKSEVIIPEWLSNSTMADTQQDKKVKKVIDAISNGKIPAKEVHDFAESYVSKKSESLESKNLVSIIRQVLNEDKSISISDKQINSFINDYRNKKTSDLIQTVFKEVNEKIDSEVLSTVKDVKQYSDIVNKVMNENKSLVESKKVFDLTSKVVNQISEGKISNNLIKSTIKSIEDRSVKSDIGTVVSLVNNKLSNNEIHSDKYSNTINKIFSENKNLVESKSIADIAHKVLSQTTDKKASITDIKDFITQQKKSASSVNNYTKDIQNKKTSSVIEEVFLDVTNILRKSQFEDNKYSNVIDKVFSENKYLVDSKNVSGIVEKVLRETGEKNISESNISSFINNYEKDIKDKKDISNIETVSNLVNNRLNKNIADNKDISLTDIEKYSHIVDKVFLDNTKLVENKHVSNLIHRVLNETSDKHISYDQISQVVKGLEDKKTKNVIETITSLVNNKVEQHSSSQDLVNTQNLVSKSVTVDDVKKYSQVVDKVVSENKSLVDNKNISAIVHKAVSDVSDKTLSSKEVSSLINNYKSETENKKASSIIETVVKLAEEKAQKNIIASDLKNKLVNENVTIEKVNRYSDIINTVDNQNKINEVVSKAFQVQKEISDITTITENKNTSISDNISKYKNFVQNITRVPGKVLNGFIENYSQIMPVQKKSDFSKKNNAKNQTDLQKSVSENIVKNFIESYEKETGKKVTDNVLNNFINNYQERKFFTGTTDLQGTPGIDKIPIWASQHEAIIPAAQNNLYKPVVKAVFEGTIPAEHLNSFVNNYHSIKTVPQPNYEKIKEAAELKINSDGKMVVAINEQNKLIVENNDLQRETLRAMKTMGINFNWDKDGVEVSLMEALEKRERNKRV